MFTRWIDNEYAPVVRENFNRLVWGRLISNACYRFAPPFIAVIARGLDVSVAELGIAFTIGEFAGLLSPVIGRYVDRANRLVSMTLGMSLIVLAVIIAAASNGVVMFAVAMFLLSGSKVLFDTSLIVWVNDHVPYERRGSIVGIIETSWALSLFIGVALMGLATTLMNWRMGFLVGAFALALCGVLIVKALPRHDAHAPTVQHTKAKVPPRAWLIFGCSFCLMGASQCVSITFGPWFEDEFGFTSLGIIVIVVALGIFELFSSVGSSRVTDVWGKENSMQRGVALMVVSGVAISMSTHQSWIALPMLIAFITGFEFALVSMLPLAANLVPAAGGIGLGLTVGAGTCGRALFSSVATQLYDTVGPVGPAITATALAGTTVVLIATYARSAR